MSLFRRGLFGLSLVVLIVMTLFPLMNVSQPLGSTIQPTIIVPQQHTWQTFNRNMNVTTFVSPDGSRDELWHFLNAAQESIYVEIYGINHPHILDLIHQLNASNPSLDMKFLLGWNSLGYTSENQYVAYNLTQAGFEVRWTSNTDFTYAHQKFVIIDNETTIIHSGNWAKTSFPEFQKKANREWSIAMTDTQITSYYRAVFDGDWRNGTAYDISHGTGSPLTYSPASSTYSHPFATAGEFSGSMNVTPIVSPDTSLQGILYCINIAQATLDIQIPYFTSVGDGGAVDDIIDAILAAKARGVTVRVITEEDQDWVEIEQILIDNDISIVWHDTRWFTANHNKGIIVDGRIVLVSSINYSDNSITNNREAGVIIENEEIAQWYLQVYNFDWGIADCDAMEEVNVYWNPSIPKSSNTINVTVYGHMLYPDIDEVQLDVKIGSDPWSNQTITSNIYPSAEGQLENFFREIPAQPDGTNITVVGRIRNATTWHIGIPMVIRVRNALVTVNQPPSTPTLADPGTVDTDGSFTVSWSAATDPDGTVNHYQLQISDADTFTTVTDEWNTSGTSQLVTVTSQGVYYFRVRAIDNQDLNGAWSNTVDITVLLPPSAPSLNNPGDIDVVGTFTVSWTASTDPDGTVTHYQFQISDTSGFATILFTTNTTQLSQVVTAPNGVYYFRVRAIDNDGNPSPWSNTESITVEVPFIPGFPIEAIILSVAIVLLTTLMLRRRRQ